MCVIMASRVARPTEDMMRQGWEKNPFGAGVAWRETDKKGETFVRWVKGINSIEDTIKLVNKIEGPLVVHFRIPTEGLGDISLTHPFPVTPEVDLAFEGKTKDKLLFHNGSWSGWRAFSLETAQKAGRKLPPKGMLSDSRMMAWNGDFYGDGFFQLINEKVILFSPTDIQIFGQKENGGWEFDKDNKIWFSNMLWKTYRPTQGGVGYSPSTNLPRNDRHDGAVGGSRPQGSFRTDGRLGFGNPLVDVRGTEQHEVEGREAQLQARTEQDRKVVGRDGNAAIRRPLIADPEFVAEARKVGDTSVMGSDWVRSTRRIMAHRAEGLVM